MGPGTIRRGDRPLVLRPASPAGRGARLAARSPCRVASLRPGLGRLLPVLGGRRRPAFRPGHPARAAGPVRDRATRIRTLFLPRPRRNQRSRRARGDRRRADASPPYSVPLQAARKPPHGLPSARALAALRPVRCVGGCQPKLALSASAIVAEPAFL